MITTKREVAQAAVPAEEEEEEGQIRKPRGKVLKIGPEKIRRVEQLRN